MLAEDSSDRDDLRIGGHVATVLGMRLGSGACCRVLGGVGKHVHGPTALVARRSGLATRSGLRRRDWSVQDVVRRQFCHETSLLGANAQWPPMDG